MKKTVGIDLGTTYTVVSTYDENIKYPRVLKNSYQEGITPSVIFFDNKDIVIGKDAKTEYAGGALETVAFYKRHMGDKDYNFNYKNKEYDAADLSGIFLKSLIKEIEKEENIKIGSAVITVPAYFGDAARNSTIDAGKYAGLDNITIISEPTSAIIAHGLTDDNKNRKVMVFDLGGGTFDVSIADVSGVDIKILSTDGDSHLGGKDFDDAIVNFLISKFEDEYGYDPTLDDIDYKNILLHDAEELKIRLTSVDNVNYRMRSGGNALEVNISRGDFEFASESTINKTTQIINQALAAANLDWNLLDEVILIGGSTRMPIVSKFIEERTGKPPLFSADVDLTVSFGAAIKADLENNKTKGNSGFTLIKKPNSNTVLTLTAKNIKDVTAHTLGILSKDADLGSFINSHILLKNSNYNTESNQSYRTNSDKLELYLLQGESKDPLYNDLTGLYQVQNVSSGMEVEVYIKYNDNGVVDVRATSNNKDLKIIKQSVNETMAEVLERLAKEEDQSVGSSEAEILFAIDISGSMGGLGIKNAKEALAELIQTIEDPSIKFSLISFNNDVKDYGLTDNRTKVLKDIKGLSAFGGTGALPLSYIEMNYPFKDNSKIIVLTDGQWFNQAVEMAAAERLKTKEFEIYAIGFADADKHFLNSIASNGLGEKIDLSNLQQTFKKIGSSIATELKNTKR